MRFAPVAGDHSMTVILVRGTAKLRLYASQAARTRQPEFNLNTGDPTKSVRVLVTKRAPLVVAERFKMLEALFPGRIDLGLGRAPGTDQMTARALRQHLATALHHGLAQAPARWLAAYEKQGQKREQFAV